MKMKATVAEKLPTWSMEDCHLACSSSATISSLAAACNTAGQRTHVGKPWLNHREIS